MAEARSREAWNHTAATLAMLANIHRNPKKGRVFKPADFNPYEARKKKGIPLRAENIGLLKHVFVKEKSDATSPDDGGSGDGGPGDRLREGATGSGA